MPQESAMATVRDYYAAWTCGDYERAASHLAADLLVEVPVNEYPDAASFAAALASFGSLAREVRLLSAMSDGEEAMLLYDMEVEGLGRLRVVEHFTLDGGRIVRLRQIHDTAAIRAAGFAGNAG
jgi:ketosteroid isomerase-like protein